MKKWLCLVLFLTTLTYSITALLPSRVRVSAAEDDLQLHAKYAVLLDGDSGHKDYELCHCLRIRFKGNDLHHKRLCRFHARCPVKCKERRNVYLK